MSLWRWIGRPPFVQLNACSTEFAFKHTGEVHFVATHTSRLVRHSALGVCVLLTSTYLSLTSSGGEWGIDEHACLDVLVTRSKDRLSTAVYRKPTHTDQYISYHSYVPPSQNANRSDARHA